MNDARTSNSACPCCGHFLTDPIDVRVLETLISYDRKEVTRPVIIRTIDDDNPVTEIQRCDRGTVFFRYSFDKVVKRRLMCMDIQ